MRLKNCDPDFPGRAKDELKSFTFLDKKVKGIKNPKPSFQKVWDFYFLKISGLLYQHLFAADTLIAVLYFDEIHTAGQHIVSECNDATLQF